MIEFKKPDFPYNYQVSAQIDALRNYRDTKPGRFIPQKDEGRLLIATWNIANLGLQERRENDYRILAELINWFDLIALQEVSDDLSGLSAILENLPASYNALFSDKAGNNERLAFLYESPKVKLLEKIGEIAIPPSSIRYIKLPGIAQKFRGFDRNPYLAAFQVGDFIFLPVNAHLYFGSDKYTTDHSKRDMNRRCLEAYAVARWADLRRKSDYAFTPNIIPLGDFNLPKAEEGDPVYDALKSRGLHIPEHSTEMGGTNLGGSKHYDQIAFFPGPTEEVFVNSGVFDFDGIIFATLWDERGKEDFNTYVRYYISDHRIMWAEFQY